MKLYNYFDEMEGVSDSVFEPIKPPADEPPHSSIFEESPSDGDRISELGGMQTRSQAMGVVLTWVEEGDLSIEAMDAIAQGIADLDGDGELSDAEQEELDAMYDQIADAMVSLGADSEGVDAFLADGDNEMGAKVGEFLSGKLDNNDVEDDLLVSRFAVGDDLVLEAGKRRVVRNGQIRFIKKRTHKIRLSAAQRAALKKARRRANTGAARIARRKSMKIRKQKGL